MMQRWMLVLACLGVMVWAAGCRVHVDKGANGDEKKVQVDTPFGGIRVNTGQTTAADVGLPAYPGAQLVNGDDNHKSADVRMGFGDWEMRVQVASYSTADSEDKVGAFYRKALSSYGDVIACRDGSAVGGETKTSEGLTCSDHGHAHVSVDDQGEKYGYQPEHGGLELKAGSEPHQHIVAFEHGQAGQTRFALVALDLPGAGSGNAGKSD
jgi:hypothetical protein